MGIGAKDWSQSAIGWYCNVNTHMIVEGEEEGMSLTEKLYTVPTGNTLYLVACIISYVNKTGGYGYAQVSIYTSADVEDYIIIYINPPSGKHIVIPLSYYPPIKIPSGYKIKVTSGGGLEPIFTVINGVLI